MADTILIHPENRLLGSPGGDFGFAAAPFSFADYRPAITFGGTHPPVADPEPTAMVVALPEPDARTGVDAVRIDDASGASTMFRPPPDGEPMQTGTNTAPDPLSLAQVQQSALTPISLTPLIDLPGADRAVVDPATTPAAETVPMQAAAAQAATATQPDNASQPDASTQPTAGPASTLPISPPLADGAQTVVSPLPEAVDIVPSLNFLPALAAPSLVLPTLPALPALPAIEIPAIDDVAGLVEASTGPLSGIVDEVEAGVGDLLGADPAGGVTTLVSLVSVTDIFDLRQIDAPPPAAVEPVISLLDALGAEPPLLSDPGDDDDSGDGSPLPLPVALPLPPIIDPDPIGGLL